MRIPRTSCLECGEELWTAAEARGFCVGCQLEAMREERPENELEMQDRWNAEDDDE